MPATASIYFHPDVVERSDTPLAGRRTAGQSFMQGYARHVKADALHCVADTPKVVEDFRKLMTGYGWTGPIEGALSFQPANLIKPGTVMLPGPGLDKNAWVRRRVGQRAYSICGITHTVSTRRITDSIFDLMASPVENWDAIICTSKAVQDVVQQQVTEAARYLARRFGARRMPAPMLPIIPLGIDTAKFAHDPAARARWRTEFDIADDTTVLLSVARLSVFEKLHPAPLAIAAQRAAEETGERVALIMAGWFSDDGQEKLHRDAVAELAPDVDVYFPDGKDPDLRVGVWSAADVFVFPVDNIQETFGLAPVEAMAAGLPVVCSDWNGFKDTVDHGTTGYRIRTLMSPPGSGQEIAHRFADQRDQYLQYLGFVHQRTAIDIREMAKALSVLIRSPEQRKAMGAAGVARARQLYDWQSVIPQYQELWGEQAARRTREIPTSHREGPEPPSPKMMDPFTLYRSYPSDSLTLSAVVSAERTMSAEDTSHLLELPGAKYIRRSVANAEMLANIQSAISAHGPIRLDQLIAKLEAERHMVTASVLWLAKYDCVQITV